MSLITNIIVLISVVTIALCGPFHGDLYVHDPTFIRSDHCYYIFGSVWYNDPANRRLCNDQSVKTGPIFQHGIPKWVQNFTKIAPGVTMWAPDINHFNDQFYVYYAVSSTGSRNSVIALATAKNIEGPYTDQGEVIHTTDAMDHNAIDPEIAWTYENGKPTQLWMIFGSWWTGIKARRLDPKTGHLSHEDTRLYALAERNSGLGIEGSSVTFRNGYYYLFVSFDLCCKGVASTYRIMMGRSQHITGPYIDRAGVPMMKGGGTQILATHNNVHGPGGQDVINDNGVYRMIYHWYDANENGRFKYDIVDLVWSQDGWPTVGAQSKLNYH